MYASPYSPVSGSVRFARTTRGFLSPAATRRNLHSSSFAVHVRHGPSGTALAHVLPSVCCAIILMSSPPDLR
eukprot:2420871-Rhodomonas_salina.1